VEGNGNFEVGLLLSTRLLLLKTGFCNETGAAWILFATGEDF